MQKGGIFKCLKGMLLAIILNKLICQTDEENKSTHCTKYTRYIKAFYFSYPG